ncbi:MAG: serine/threonine protein kinase [Deltaproteobacteria bacterium]|nr:serine/threonine protein kinase [Deltaproteobacteria bacterium]
MNSNKQKCPICEYVNDVSIYVTGQKVRCERCQVPFEVKRSESFDGIGGKSGDLSRGIGQNNAPKETLIFSDIPQISGYEIIGLIGKGGMGAVYKARQLSLNRLVAIKVLKGEYATQKDFILRFNREAEVLAKLSHPNIVPIIDKGAKDGLFYFVMEFIEGETLRQKLKNGRLRFDEAIKYTLQILRAISFAHKQNVIHRDLKPENVLIDLSGNVRIADFGLADIVGVQNDYSLTGSGMAMGTAHYMAPEQRRDAKRVDKRADIFSLGITLYEMLAGEIPHGNFKKICQIRNDVNPQIDIVIEKAIASKPQDRYQSADEMAVAIRAALVDEEKKTKIVSERNNENAEVIQVKSFNEDKKVNKFILFGLISSLFILVVVLIILWILR